MLDISILVKSTLSNSKFFAGIQIGVYASLVFYGTKCVVIPCVIQTMKYIGSENLYPDFNLVDTTTSSSQIEKKSSSSVSIRSILKEFLKFIIEKL